MFLGSQKFPIGNRFSPTSSSLCDVRDSRRGVSVAPGRTALTLIPYEASSKARCLVNPSNPAFEAV